PTLEPATTRPEYGPRGFAATGPRGCAGIDKSSAPRTPGNPVAVQTSRDIADKPWPWPMIPVQVHPQICALSALSKENIGYFLSQCKMEIFVSFFQVPA